MAFVSTPLKCVKIIRLLTYYRRKYNPKKSLKANNKPATPISAKKYRAHLKFGLIILLSSILIGNLIKKPLLQFYLNMAIINFQDFTSAPKEENLNFAICLYLGDHYFYLKKHEKALRYYLKAEKKAQTFTDLKTIQNRLILIRPYFKDKKLIH